MKQRKRRLCTTFLCAVLIATNVFSTCLPVYAKALDADTTNEFFKGVSKVSSEELSSSQILNGSFRDLDYSYEWDEQADSFYQVSGTFAGADALTPETTYYYRLAYYNYNSTERKYYYHFLTVPAQFTMGPPVAETSISIKDISVEEIGCQKAKVVWTISNPDKSPVSRIRLLPQQRHAVLELSTRFYQERQ